MGCRRIGRIVAVDNESETRHLISGSWMDDVNALSRLEEGSMSAEEIRYPPYPGRNPSMLTYGANDEAKLEEFIVVEGNLKLED